MLPDRLFYPLVALTAAGLVVLALMWPQGQGSAVHTVPQTGLRPAVSAQ